MVNFLKNIKRKEIISLAVVVFLLLVIPPTIYLSKKSQEIRKKAAENDNREEFLKKKPDKPEYIEGEAIIKFKVQSSKFKVKEGKDLDKEVVTFNDLEQSSIPSVLNDINKKYKIEKIEKVFKGAEDPQTELSKFKQKFSSEISSGKRKINDQEFLKVDLSRTYKINFDRSYTTEQVIQEFSQNPEIEYAEPNYVYKVNSEPNDPYFLDSYPNNVSFRDPNWNPPHDYQWNIKKTNSSNNWEVDISGIVVAVIDSGVDITHPELGNIWVNNNEIPGDGIDNDNNGCWDDINGCNFLELTGNITDDYNHGTHVAGVISAKTNNSIGLAGVTNNTKIMTVKTMNADGFGNASHLAPGIKYTADNGARVINMSLGGSYSELVKEALDYVTNLGVIVVVSAGNGNNYSMSSFPASYKKAITVGAVDENLNKLKYSNYGSNIDVMAPGGGSDCMFQSKPGYCSNILSLKSSQNNNDLEHVVGGQYLRMSGTSMAAPHVAGIVALLLSQHPNFTLGDIENYFRFNSINPLNQGHTEKMGWGVVSSNGNSFIPNSNIDFTVNYPSENSLVGNQFNVEGVIKADNFDHFDVDYRKKGSSSWRKEGVILINSGVGQIIPILPKELTRIATITLPSGAENGEYEIRTTLFLQNGKNLIQTKVINFNKKPGTNWYYQKSSNDLPENGEILVSDINNDGKKEIIHYNFGLYDDRRVKVFDSNYSLLWSANEKGEVVVGDIDKRSPGKEVVIQTSSKIIVYSANGNLIPDMTLNFTSDQVSKIANLLVVDADNNGKDELYFFEKYYTTKQILHCFEQNNSNEFLEKWSFTTNYSPSKYSSPIAGDLNGDGFREILIDTTNGLAALNYFGNLIVQSNVLGNILGDIDKDGKEEIIGYRDGAIRAYKLKINNTIDEIWNFPTTASPIALSDFNNDGYLDIYFYDNSISRFEGIIKNDGTLLYRDSAMLYSSYGYPNISFGDRDGNGKIEVYFSGQRNVDSRSYILTREYDYQTSSFNFIDNDWKSVLPECGDTLKYGCGNNVDVKVALVDLENNGKTDLIWGGIGIIEYESIGKAFWPHRFHDYQRTGSYNFDLNIPTPTSIPTVAQTPIVIPTLTPVPEVPNPNFGKMVRFRPPGITTCSFIKVLPNSKLLMGRDSTIEFWFKPHEDILLPERAGSGLFSLLAKGGLSGGGWGAYNIFIALPRTLNETFHLQKADGSYALGQGLIANPNILQSGQWYFFKLVKQGNTISQYINGNLVGTVTFSESEILTEKTLNPLYIGNWKPYGSTGCFSGYKGDIDELRLSNIARPSESIPTTPFTSDSNTIALYHFDGNANDTSGNNFNGIESGVEYISYPVSTIRLSSWPILTLTPTPVCPKSCPKIITKNVGKETNNSCYIYLSWEKVRGATGYNIYKSGIFQKTVSVPNYTLRYLTCKTTGIKILPITNIKSCPSISCPELFCAMPYTYPGSCR